MKNYKVYTIAYSGVLTIRVMAFSYGEAIVKSRLLLEDDLPGEFIYENEIVTEDKN